jgi:pyruvate formate lyase activating enzyme
VSLAAPDAPVSRFAEKLDGGRVRCTLCPKRCALAEGAVGLCRTRVNRGGALRSVTHGRLLAAAVDPIEKKPLYHYRPGSAVFSIASAGCNLVCPFCQNHHLSQLPRTGTLEDAASARRWSAAEIVEQASARRCASIAFTYSEPILSLELAEEVAAPARAEGIDLVFVTNGQGTPEAIGALGGILAAANVDLKCFDAGKYERVLGGSLEATLHAIRAWRERGVWVEVTTLAIPGFNDGDDELGRIAAFLAGVDPDMPWHVSRFHPAHEWTDRPATPVRTLERALEIGRAAGLRYVYAGNAPGSAGEKTMCPACGAVLIDREGYRIRQVAVARGSCGACGARIAGAGLP